MFAKEGASVVVADLNYKGAKETCNLVKKSGGKSIFIQMDVGKASDCERMVKKALDEFGRLDILVNNAAIMGKQGRAAELTEENFDAVISVNLKGVFLASKFAIPEMLKQGGGAIVNVASTGAIVGVPLNAPYSASKGGVLLLTKAMALDYATKNIRINCVCPGYIDTPIWEQMGDHTTKERLMEWAIKQHPIKRLAEPEEIARAILFLASDEASFVMGSALIADGGLTAQ